MATNNASNAFGSSTTGKAAGSMKYTGPAVRKAGQPASTPPAKVTSIGKPAPTAEARAQDVPPPGIPAMVWATFSAEQKASIWAGVATAAASKPKPKAKELSIRVAEGSGTVIVSGPIRTMAYYASEWEVIIDLMRNDDVVAELRKQAQTDKAKAGQARFDSGVKWKDVKPQKGEQSSNVEE